MQNERSLQRDVSSSLRAAQYVRMSTDHQRYSTENQIAAIAAFALVRNISVVRTYSDEGRSGLKILGRGGLQALILDVQTKRTDFDVILVFDVSRWGRFQDVDESAYYEFVCKQGGKQVLYCAEQFENDGTFASTMQKYLKRAMAAEFSRDLSFKVFAGQCNLGRRGFWQGSSAGYGLRRALIDASGSPRMILADGERKFIQSDRVILSPGPADEVALVQRMFRSFAIDGKNEVQIAKELNEEGYVNQYGRLWNRNTISKMLSNEKYIGNNVFNRTSFKLKNKAVKNPPEMWIRSVNAFEAVVDPNLFLAAQNKFAELSRRKSNQRMLDNLSALLKMKGHLNSKVINDAESTPRTETYLRRFGSLLNAYELIGYRPERKFSNAPAKRETSFKRRSVLPDLFEDMRRAGMSIRFDFNARKYFLNDRFTVQIYMLRCLKTRYGKSHWVLRQRRRSSTDFVVGVRMDEAKGIHDYALLRSTGMSDRLAGTGEDIGHLGAICFENMNDLTSALVDATRAT